ncbi:hypothetical protein CLIM01_09859 [Colletotrichum limetticola]|uniref:Uncharacterized protein n=1 Tax=Colletotrichum limetticola TaxID=1209924 RepID=A0ABQ9PMM0_9PEZI|nr:hypothetical protein CLIM01_09859 [Colletotrichum limetticola]
MPIRNQPATAAVAAHSRHPRLNPLQLIPQNPLPPPKHLPPHPLPFEPISRLTNNLTQPFPILTQTIRPPTKPSKRISDPQMRHTNSPARLLHNTDMPPKQIPLLPPCTREPPLQPRLLGSALRQTREKLLNITRSASALLLRVYIRPSAHLIFQRSERVVEFSNPRIKACDVDG